MKQSIIYKKIMAFILSIIILQGGVVIPVFAADTFWCDFYYREESLVSQEHPILYAELYEGEYSTQYHLQKEVPYGEKFLQEAMQGDAKPARILGYTFDGWYTAANGGGNKIEDDTIFNSGEVVGHGLTLYANWIEYNSPDITSDSLEFKARNLENEPTSSNIVLKDSGGVEVDFDSEVTEYYATVYGNITSINMDFEQYEPMAKTTITCNGVAVNTAEEYITGTGYWFNEQEVLEKHTDINTGKNISTDYMPLEFTADDKEYNEIEIKVELPENDVVNTKTYKFYIKRVSNQIHLEYGNTPYGRIMTNEMLTADGKIQAMADFDSTFTYRNIQFFANAWNPYGATGVEVVKGTEVSGNEYINYDKDETAIIVYSGERFTDPGVAVYDKDNQPIAISTSNPVTRTINYSAVSSLKYENWGSTTEKTNISTITGNSSDYEIDLLTSNEVKPGVYTIDYSYNDANGITATSRNLIVLPKPGDTNMDGYVNSLDLYVYSQNIIDDNLINCIYKYRVLDVNNDGVVNDSDKTHLKGGNTVKTMYPSYSIEETLIQEKYVVPSVADPSKTQVYMDFLGTDANNIDAPADQSQQLEKSDVFWVGYRFENTSNIADMANDVKSMTLSINYDSRYLKPDAASLAAWINTINSKNTNLSVFNIEGTSAIAGKHMTDKSVSSQTWDDLPSVKTLKIEMYLKNGENFKISDSEYLIKMPFKVVIVPPSGEDGGGEGKTLFATQLGVNNFNMNFGNSFYGFAWDTSDSLNSVTTNLMTNLQYMGDYVPVFEAEADAIKLATVTYGETVAIFKTEFAKGTLQGDLPEGIKYISNVYKIEGTAKESGTFTFRINGIKYSIEVEKAEMLVTADDKTKTYGDSNPTLTLTYDESCLKNSDDIAAAIQIAPTITCAADVTTEYLDEVPIVLSDGESENYYFTFTDGKITVDTQKEINVTAISNIPNCTAHMANNETFPLTIDAEAASDKSEFTATGIVNNDKVKISYGAVYPNNTVGTNITVGISNPAIVSDETTYARGKNYTLTCITSSGGGMVGDESVSSFTVRSSCKNKYTYGETLDLNSGRITVKYDSGRNVETTFEGAKAHGIRIYYSDGITEANTGDQLTIKDHDKKNLWIDVPGNSNIPRIRAMDLEIAKRDLDITADNKAREYGESNDTLTFTYTVDTNDLVFGDSEATINLTPPTFSCSATASTEVDKDNGYGEADIVLTGGSSDNYNIVCHDGVLTINKRKIDIAITSDVPALTAANYTGKIAPFKVEASAIAGGTETASMTVTGLYNNDQVKMKYNAQYADATPIESVQITAVDCAMDDAYGKSYNYVVNTVTNPVSGGRVYAKNLTSLEIIEQPTLEYTYGEPLNLKTGKIKIKYDSNEELEVDFDSISTHNVEVTYSGTTTAPVQEEHLIVADTGKKITLTPETIYDDVSACTTDEITVNKHDLNISADDIYTTYGESIPSYTYSYKESDFQYDDKDDIDNIAGLVKPTLVCKADDGVSDLTEKTLSGIYAIKISGADADNYNIIHTNGKVTIRQRPLVVSAIGNIPSLSAEDAFDKNLSFDYAVETDTNNDLTFAPNYGLLWDDRVRILYTVTYPDSTIVGETDVNIEKTSIDKSFGNVRNYYLQSVVSTQKGKIIGAIISDIEITADPTKTSDGSKPFEYSYGDTLDLSGGKFKISYDSGKVDEDVTFEDLKDYGITAVYTGTSDEVTDGVFVTIDDHNNKTITLNPPAGAPATSITTGNIVVNKREMHVLVDDASSIYGTEPSYTFGYKTEDFATGETKDTAFTNLVEPVLSCTINSEIAGVTTDTGVYTDMITASGGSCDNYEFVYEDKGTLTVNARELTIKSIDDLVPELTAAEIYNNNYVTPIKLDGTATNDNITLENLVNNDDISITYKVVYNSIEESDSITVGIEDVKFATDCVNKDNYKIISSPTTATGKILSRIITAITVKQDPTKMEYTYGDWFKLAGGAVDITYNSGYVRENVAFEDLKGFGVNLEFNATGGEVKNNTLLTVKEHNGSTIKLTVPSQPEVVPAYSGEIKVNKHKMKVVAEDNSMVYGSDAPTYSFHYNAGDLVNADSLTSSRFADNLVDPTVSCTVNSLPADKLTFAGEYDIVPSGGSADNYEFVYVNATLTVEKRELKILSINSGVPDLTAELIYLSGGKAPIKIDSSAVNDDLTLDGIVNDDEIKILYKAVYESILPSEFITVKIEDVAFDDTPDANKNYKITEKPSTATGGTVLKEQITKVEITKDPTVKNSEPIKYTYGDSLNLHGGEVTVSYNSNRVQTGIKFSEITEKTDGHVTLVYTGTEDPATHNDTLNAWYHNGKSITLKISTEASDVEEPQTLPLVVEKAVMNVTVEDEEKYYGEDNPEFTFEYDGFVNGDDENSDGFKLNLIAPEIVCTATKTSPVGSYEIELSEGSSANYSFNLMPAVLTVKKRPIEIISITDGIPVLTSKILFEEPYLIHRLKGTAVNNQMKIGNILEGDEIKINYTAMYSSIKEAQNVIVNIVQVSLDDEYGESSNYILDKVPDISVGGRIYEKQISKVQITKQPKTEYTYGDSLDLSEKGVQITYDSGLVVSNIAYNELDEYGVDITYTSTSETVSDGEKLTVPKYNGESITITPTTTLSGVNPIVTEKITVNKKQLDVIVDDSVSTYGDMPTFTFKYDEGDFEYEETQLSPEFLNNLVIPKLTCNEKDGVTAVGKQSDVGEYAIKASEGFSENYEFVYHDGELSIEKRVINILDITDGVPPLTSDIIYADPSTTHKLDAAAVNNQMSVENLVNNDEIRITYKAVYDSVAPVSSCRVSVEDVLIDETSGKGYNYQLGNVMTSVGGGVVYGREITEIVIEKQPDLAYTYGEKLKLTGGNVTITYDSGLVENVTFDKLVERGITLTYEGTEDVVSDNDLLNVPYHNGKKITLTPKSVHGVSPIVTEPISVKKKTLYYGDSTVNSIVYDGKTTLTSGNIVLTGIEYEDAVTAEGIFNFESVLAGENKRVYITDVKLKDEFTANYELSGTSTQTTGIIERADIIPSLNAEGITISAKTNAVTITAPELTEELKTGGAKYLYSIDGGNTWSESGEFENPGLGKTCKVCVKFAQTNNYNESILSVPIDFQTYKVKFSLVENSEEGKVLAEFYTNITSIANEEELKKFIGEIETTYYGYYADESIKQKVTYPIELSGDVKFYTTLEEEKKSGKGGGSKSTPTPTPTPTPIPTITPTPTVTPSVEPTQDPFDNRKIKYMSGYMGEFEPDRNMTRAEVATVMSVISGKYDESKEYPNKFLDVYNSTWYYNYVGFAAQSGFVSGYSDDTFRPEIEITRGEFVSIIARYIQVRPVEDVYFTDTPVEVWSSGYISALAELDIVSGYDDGSFLPEENIRRSEAVTIINKAINRIPNITEIDKIPCPFIDVPYDHWAYYQIMEASCDY